MGNERLVQLRQWTADSRRILQEHAHDQTPAASPKRGCVSLSHIYGSCLLSKVNYGTKSYTKTSSLSMPPSASYLVRQTYNSNNGNYDNNRASKESYSIVDNDDDNTMNSGGNARRRHPGGEGPNFTVGRFMVVQDNDGLLVDESGGYDDKHDDYNGYEPHSSRNQPQYYRRSDSNNEEMSSLEMSKNDSWVGFGSASEFKEKLSGVPEDNRPTPRLPPPRSNPFMAAAPLNLNNADDFRDHPQGHHDDIVVEEVVELADNDVDDNDDDNEESDDYSADENPLGGDDDVGGLTDEEDFEGGVNTRNEEFEVDPNVVKRMRELLKRELPRKSVQLLAPKEKRHLQDHLVKKNKMQQTFSHLADNEEEGGVIAAARARSEAVRSRVRSQASSSRKKKTATSLHSRASDESPREHYRRKTRHSNNKSKSPTRRKKDGESSKKKKKTSKSKRRGSTSPIRRLKDDSDSEDDDEIFQHLGAYHQLEDDYQSDGSRERQKAKESVL